MPIIDFIIHIFVLFVYQPFFNILVLFYGVLDVISDGNANMGIAVILLAILLRIILLPLSIRGMRTEHVRAQISSEISEIEQTYAHEPIEMQRRRKELLRSKPKLVFAEVFNLVVQIIVAIMVWRMFGTGLTGEDLELIYPIPFLQDVSTPFNLMFRGYDLSEKSVWFVLIAILLLFLLETLSVLAAPKGSLSRSRALKAQIILPFISFFLFLLMPAGKVLFLITTFIFSIGLTLYKLFVIRFEAYKVKQSAPTPTEERVLVETK